MFLDIACRVVANLRTNLQVTKNNTLLRNFSCPLWCCKAYLRMKFIESFSQKIDLLKLAQGNILSKEIFKW